MTGFQQDSQAMATHQSLKPQNTFMGLGMQRKEADAKRFAMRNIFNQNQTDRVTRGGVRATDASSGIHPLDMVSLNYSLLKMHSLVISFSLRTS